ncbi:unnamed protein product [Urochloa decumbens]|uniref:Bowman-Birk serine protease inhibitors family domain-containing protein n=1 Tax=Urochloa decumbens TaxID=240449 RepID=A0ABC8ZFZ8_9POAL
MSTQAALFITLAVVLAAAPPLALGNNGHEEVVGGAGDAASRKRWPCCDECGVCTRSLPPICSCSDTSASGCNPACAKCVKSIDNDGEPVFQCEDMIINFCKHRCTRPAAAAAAAEA